MPVKIVEDVFGEAVNPITKKSEKIKRFTITNDHKVSVQVINLGATITSLKVPDECGQVDDIVLGFDDVAGYQSAVNPYFGATIGRVCNRIGNGKFTLNGRQIDVSKNFQNKHQLHGGFIGFDKMHWDASIEEDTVVMTHVSEAGHEGYPGQVTANVRFSLNNQNELKTIFLATSTEPTPVNLTNHSYFNLAGHDAGSKEIYEHMIKINANEITETDDDSIPTGDFNRVENTPYDLTTMSVLGEKFQQLFKHGAIGYDDNYCVNLQDLNTTLIAKASHPKSGRWMEVYSNQPGVQFYTSNFLPDDKKGLEGINGKGGGKYFKHGAFCLETQKYPDSVNHANFPSTILSPGETYNHELILKFGSSTRECKD